MTASGDQRNVTIRDVAAVSGFSVGTVSRHVNGGHHVSQRAAQAITAAIKQTGYTVNPHARSLRRASTSTVAFLLPKPLEELFADPVFAVIGRECGRALAAAGHSMVMLMADSDEEQRRAIEYITTGHVDGVLVTGIESTGSPMVHQLVDRGVPLVACTAPNNAPGVTCVSSDTFAGTKMATRHLIERGRRELAHVALEDDRVGENGRRAGFLEGAGELARLDMIQFAPRTKAGGRHAAELLLERGTMDGIVCGNDAQAAGVIEVLTAKGIRVPQDVAVVGLDNVVPLCESTTPPLTSVAQDFAAIADSMVSHYLRIRAGGDVRIERLPMTLVERSST